MEKIEEENLLRNLAEMNYSYNTNDKKNFMASISNLCSRNVKLKLIQSKSVEKIHQTEEKTKRSFSHDFLDHPDLNMESLARKLEETTGHESSQTNSSISTNYTMSFNLKCDHIISQNLVLAKETLKLIIIGDKGVGKTCLSDSLSKNRINRKAYEPTQR